MRDRELTERIYSDAVLERFWAKVERAGEDECWIWLGAHDGRGYGTLYVNGRNRRATQISIEIATNLPFPAGKLACHHCDNPPCVNPKHLFVGSMKDNMRDCIAKGRFIQPPIHKRGYNRLKTHCKRGHPLSGENLIRTRQGRRSCKQCMRASQRNYDRARRATITLARQALKQGQNNE